MKAPRHNCRDHVVEKRGPNGGRVGLRCGVCKSTVRLKRGEVLMRVTA